MRVTLNELDSIRQQCNRFLTCFPSAVYELILAYDGHSIPWTQLEAIGNRVRLTNNQWSMLVKQLENRLPPLSFSIVFEADERIQRLSTLAFETGDQVVQDGRVSPNHIASDNWNRGNVNDESDAEQVFVYCATLTVTTAQQTELDLLITFQLPVLEYSEERPYIECHGYKCRQDDHTLNCGSCHGDRNPLPSYRRDWPTYSTLEIGQVADCLNPKLQVFATRNRDTVLQNKLDSIRVLEQRLRNEQQWLVDWLALPNICTWSDYELYRSRSIHPPPPTK